MGWPVPPRLPAVVSLTLPIMPAVVTVALLGVPELELTARESDSGTANPGIDTCEKKEKKINNKKLFCCYFKQTYNNTHLYTL
jgi:hypothetical protein